MNRLAHSLVYCCLTAIVVATHTGCQMGRVYRPSGYDTPTGLSGRIQDNCEACGDEPCNGHGGYTFAEMMRSSMSCGSGCSEIYWGEWRNDPPDACDPCDEQRNWIGRSTGKRPMFWRFNGLKGGRFHEDCVGCPDCANGGDLDGEIIMESQGEPTVAEPPVDTEATQAANNWSARRVGYWQLSGRKE